MAACCYFEVNLRNQLAHNFPSRLTDGTPDSSSDLLFSSLVLLVTLLDQLFWVQLPSFPLTLMDKVFSVKFIFPLSPYLDNYSKSNSSSSSFLRTKLFQVQILSTYSSSWTNKSKSNFDLPKHSKTVSFPVIAANSLQFYKDVLRQFLSLY